LKTKTKDMHWVGGSTSPLLRAAGALVDWKSVMRLGTALLCHRAKIDRTLCSAGLNSCGRAQVVVRYGQGVAELPHANQQAGDSSMRSTIPDRVIVLGKPPG
jgi:hypothetical protein